MTILTLPRLRAALAHLPRDPVVPVGEDRIHAAVSLVLRGEGEGIPELLLIKRALSPRDPWSGHMALPGGRLDPGDPHLLATAVRETLEETGVVLSTDPQAGYLGHLPRVAPESRNIPRVAVVPHLFTAEAAIRARAASHEVERIRWVSLETFLDPRTRGEMEVHLPGRPRTFPCYRVEGDVVWGLTYRILADFLAQFAGD